MRSFPLRGLGPIFVIACACGPARIGPSAEAGTEATGDSTDATSDDETASTQPETDSADDNGFLPPESDMSNECDPWLQDCPEGEKCAPFSSFGSSWDSNKCVPIIGNQAIGEPCIHDGLAEGTDDCDGEGMCWYAKEIDGELHGTCVAFCEGTPDEPECAQGFYCPVTGDGSLNICLPVCDPIAQDCADGLACFWASNQFICVETSEEIPLGEPCGYVNDCAAGHMCVGSDSLPDCADAACCAAFCDLQLGDAQCEGVPGTTCVPFFVEGMEPPEYQDVGLCIVA